MIRGSCAELVHRLHALAVSASMCLDALHPGVRILHDGVGGKVRLCNDTVLVEVTGLSCSDLARRLNMRGALLGVAT